MFGWEFPPHNSGGLGVACQGIVRALAQLGDDITLVLPRKLNVSTPYARILFADYGVQGRVINSVLTPYLTAAQYTSYGLSGRPIYGANLVDEVLRYAEAAQPIAEEKEYDVIYAHDWLAFPAGLMAKRVTGKPLVVHVHSTEYDRCGGPRGFNQNVYEIEKKGMEEADRIIALSHYMKSIIVQYYGIPAGKIEVIHNGIDEETMPTPGNSRSQLSSLKEAGHSLVLFLGRITLQKGLDHLLRAARLVVEHDNKVLFLVSGSGDMERRMMEYAAELGIANNVLFTGFLRGPEQYEAFRLADLFVMPSVSEPFGIAALEAMRLGTPVIMSKQSGVSEAVQNALKVDFWDTEELANMILTMVHHYPLRSTLAENGSAEVQNLTWTRAARSINTVLLSFTMGASAMG
jgi:glycosyltransferase involved in cell wall biosynthesis